MSHHSEDLEDFAVCAENFERENNKKSYHFDSSWHRPGGNMVSSKSPSKQSHYYMSAQKPEKTNYVFEFYT